MRVKSTNYIIAFFIAFGLCISSCNKSNNKDNTSSTILVDKTDTPIKPVEVPFETQVVKNIKPIVTKAKAPQLIYKDVTQQKSEGVTIKINKDSIISYPIKPLPTKIAKPVIVKAGLPEITTALPYRTREKNSSNFKYLDVEQGLKSSLIYSVIEDKDGAMWIASKVGVTKYDGKYFYHYSETQGLVSNYCTTLTFDSKGNLWIGTYGGGVSVFDGKTFTNYSIDGGLLSNSIKTIFEDSHQNIWIGTLGGGVCKMTNNIISFFNEHNDFPMSVNSIIEDKKGTIILASVDNGVYFIHNNSFTRYNEKDGLVDKSIYSLLLDNKNNIWLGGDEKGLSKFDGNSFVNFTTKNGLPDNSIFSIIQDINNNIWLGTFKGGVSKYNRNSFLNFSTEQGLNSNSIQSLCITKNGTIWIATEGAGIAKYEGNLFTHKTTSEGLGNNWIWSTNQTKNNDYWFATNGNGLNHKKENFIESYTSNEGLNDDVTISSLKDQKNNLWIGTYNNGVSYFDNKEFKTISTANGLVENAVWSIIQDEKENVWFSTGNGIAKYDGTNLTNYFKFEAKENFVVNTSIKDKNNILWFGTNGNGLLQFKNNKFYKITTEQGLIDNTISCVLQDSLGNLWFGSQSGGVSRLKDGVFTNLSEENGLSNSAVLSMISDYEGNIWFGTRGGINKLAFSKLNSNKTELQNSKNLFTTYGINEGFTGNNCVRNSVYMDNEHKIWWGTTKMLTTYNPKADKKDLQPPVVQINSMKLFFEDVNWDAILKHETTDSLAQKLSNIQLSGTTPWNNLPINLVLPYNQNHITFNYIGINFKSQEKIKYQTILEGLDDEWTPITSETEAVFNNLPNGTFTFKIKAVNKDGVWSQPIEYTFTVNPPWWKTWWFRTIALLSIIALIYFYIKYREGVLKQRQQELEQTVDERTKEVVSQKHIVEEKQKEILDSINYAKRIQHSLLASNHLLNTHLRPNTTQKHTAEDYFILFKPKDIVSGDFYWASVLNNNMFAIVTADSTGHGVPGAIMSMLNISALNEAINGREISEPSEIFNFTRTKIISQLSNDGSAEGGKDGMDASITIYDFEHLKLHYAAANNPIWIIRKENDIYTFKELVADKMPIGKHDKDKTPFTSNTFDLQKGDIVYTLTDGYPDQFGGPKEKKFMYKQLKEIVLANADQTMEEQQVRLSRKFNNWKKDLEQVDDVLIIGVKI